MTDPIETPDGAFDERSFLALLIGDVIEVDRRHALDDTPTNRRDTVRTAFAAIDGSIWLLREHVRSVARDLDVLTPIADLALRETSYSVDTRGHVIEQIKFIALPTILRLVIAQAQLIDDRLEINLGDQGWEVFRRAIAIRNRVTHPKVASDLTISDADLKTIRRAFFWLLSVVETVIAWTTNESAAHARRLRTLHEALKNGEAWALELYHRELNTPEPGA